MHEGSLFVVSLTCLTSYETLKRIPIDRLVFLPALTALVSIGLVFLCHIVYVYFVELFVEGAAAPSSEYQRLLIADGLVVKCMVVYFAILAVGGSLSLWAYFSLIRKSVNAKNDRIVASLITLFWCTAPLFFA